MDFKEMLKDDLNEVFFSDDEFTTELIIDKDIKNPILCYFDTNTELIFDSVTEFGESAATVPSVLMKKVDADKIDHNSIIEIDGETYRLNFKDRENDLIRVYLEKRREA